MDNRSVFKIMQELCLHKIGPEKSDQIIGPEMQIAKIVSFKPGISTNSSVVNNII